MNNSKKLRSLTASALIGALYVCLTLLSALFGLSSGAVQFRISEMLAILPVFYPQAIAGVTVGCFLSNLILGSGVLDLCFGTLATLLGALGARAMRRVRFLPLAGLPTVLANALIVPAVILYATGTVSIDAYVPIFFSVALGEAVCVCIVGGGFFTVLRNKNVLPKL